MTDYIHKDNAVAYVLENCFDEISEAVLEQLRESRSE